MTKSHSSLIKQKSLLRKEALFKRKHAVTSLLNAPKKVSDNLWQAFDFPRNTIIAGYAPLPTELDIRPAIQAQPFYQWCLPVTLKDQPLLFRAWHPNDPFKKGFGSIQEPLETAPLLIPQVILVPLVAFDRHCQRLGFGGGYYDRTLEYYGQHHSITAIGVAFSVQETDTLPTEPHDKALDAIITEKDVIYPS